MTARKQDRRQTKYVFKQVQKICLVFFGGEMGRFYREKKHQINHVFRIELHDIHRKIPSKNIRDDILQYIRM